MQYRKNWCVHYNQTFNSNVVRLNTVECNIEKIGVSTIIKHSISWYTHSHNPSVRTLALLELETSEGEPYTSTLEHSMSDNTLCIIEGLCLNTKLFKLSGN